MHDPYFSMKQPACLINIGQSTLSFLSVDTFRLKHMIVHLKTYKFKTLRFIICKQVSYFCQNRFNRMMYDIFYLENDILYDNFYLFILLLFTDINLD